MWLLRRFGRCFSLAVAQNGGAHALARRSAARLPAPPGASRGLVTSTQYHRDIVERAGACSKHVSHDNAARLLSQFVDGGFDASRLRGFFASEGGREGGKGQGLSIEDYLVILQLCKQLEFQDLDLLSSLSEDVRLAFVKTYAKPVKKRRGRVPVSKDADTSTAADDRPRSVPTREFQVDTSRVPALKDAVKATSVIFNELRILHDPLFATIGDLLLERSEEISTEEAELLLRTYATQNYRDHAVVNLLVRKVETDVESMGRGTVLSVYRSLSHLELISPPLCSALENRLCRRSDDGNEIRFTFHDEIDVNQLVKLGYSKLIQGSADPDAFCVAEKLPTSAASLTASSKRKLTTLMAYLKCLSEPCYSTLGDKPIDSLNEAICADGGYKKFRTTKFVEKVVATSHYLSHQQVSEHLTKLRIRHETGIYANGVLLDIMEKDRNVVWLCNSYHRFYAASFDPTAESKAMERLIRAFGFKTCPINYYQWGRLKAKRTRFAYLRMARYYALHDQREYDHRYAGWSLPYVWWNASRQDQMHVSNYIKYEP
ncbi:hypothetical protein, conserved [Babesia bigemina]|uniref:RAP domain-containing protein n=1 Tax=Babesia bigemina TaxID=5866 RepID=A0A061DA30_BABBI|nr:hypothetical protein, conserved [Babesia bigemina]CDR95764.1 hypothetical protein, conserved [Babesia bigemina]|eukprot:XP_012767950.1 hypothetical protein, conserved [Babesia bigemina]